MSCCAAAISDSVKTVWRLLLRKEEDDDDDSAIEMLKVFDKLEEDKTRSTPFIKG
jgi:hypothetical protein